jgi:RNA polymerase sigma-70 factor (ECF subfamily)
MSDIPAAPEPGPAEIDALLQRIKAGDREAYMTVVRTYQRKVFVLAYSILRDREDALDAVQETFLRLYQKAGLFRTGNSFRSTLTHFKPLLGG